MNRVEKARLQLRAVEMLRILKTSRTYDELAETTGLPAGDLNRYVNGHVLPGIERSQAVLADVGWEVLGEELEQRMVFDQDGYVDNSRFVSDQPFLDLVAPVVAQRLEFETPDVVLTAATDGITIASALARYYGVRCAYAKKRKETAVQDFYEARKRFESGIELDYYLPTSILERNECVLVADDMIRSGETQELLLDLVDAADARVGGVFALIAAGTEGIERAHERTDAPVDALLTL